MTTACGALPHAAIGQPWLQRKAWDALKNPRLSGAEQPKGVYVLRCVCIACACVCACVRVRAFIPARTHARTHNIAHTVDPDRHRAAREVDSLLILAHSARGGPTPSSCAAAS